MESQSSINLIIDSSSTIASSEHRDRSVTIARQFILTRIHAGFFRITLSLVAQALLWKELSNQTTKNSGITLKASRFLWYLAFGTLSFLSFLYLLKCFFHFHMVKKEFYHHVGVNYLFAPWISWLLLLQSAPRELLAPNAISYLILFWVFSIPLMLLDVKVYGQWITTEKSFLSVTANPTSQVSVLGNFVGARAAARMGWKESAICMFSLGMVHYLVLFVTLFQQLSNRWQRRHGLPVILRPVYSLFFAVPSMASLAWSSISGAFDAAPKMFFFLSLFLFTSLVCRPTLFRKSMRRFNVAWWAYSFPLSFLALASVEYARAVRTQAAAGLMLGLSVLSTLVFHGLMLLTALKTDSLLRENDPALSLYKNKASTNGSNKA